MEDLKKVRAQLEAQRKEKAERTERERAAAKNLTELFQDMMKADEEVPKELQYIMWNHCLCRARWRRCLSHAPFPISSW